METGKRQLPRYWELLNNLQTATELPADEVKCPICLKPYGEILPLEEREGWEHSQTLIALPFNEDLILDLDGNDPVQLPCGHYFGKCCIKKALAEDKKCPVCRQEVFTGCRCKVHEQPELRDAFELLTPRDFVKGPEGDPVYFQYPHRMLQVFDKAFELHSNRTNLSISPETRAKFPQYHQHARRLLASKVCSQTLVPAYMHTAFGSILDTYRDDVMEEWIQGYWVATGEKYPGSQRAYGVGRISTGYRRSLALAFYRNPQTPTPAEIDASISELSFHLMNFKNHRDFGYWMVYDMAVKHMFNESRYRQAFESVSDSIALEIDAALPYPNESQGEPSFKLMEERAECRRLLKTATAAIWGPDDDLGEYVYDHDEEDDSQHDADWDENEDDNEDHAALSSDEEHDILEDSDSECVDGTG
jgi:hypothetical protein